ncbi:NUMOD1 domain-containing DNA-binding protein, partial [Arthrobacter sp. B1805]|uniref:NUMOD1 domain-containing DNA-binding protein n=1 Tax=Arthrobacter sp. B1805 TaxID=2058892 RepID=UPI00215791AF
MNHIDCNRANNTVSNLEWCTSQYNTAYRDKLGHTAKHNAPKKPVIAVNLETGKVLRFESQAEAERQLGISNQRINDVLKGRNKTAGGYLFTENESEITEEKIREVKVNMPFSGGVIAIDLNTFEAFRFESQRQAARQLGIDYSHISAV